jgi:purine-nucleoside phosphorylase
MNEFVTLTEINEAADFIRGRSKVRPVVGIVLGSGLGGVAEAVQDADVISTTELPHWPQSTVVGHVGRLVLGQLEGRPAVVLQGRVHYYEGYGMDRIVFPIRVMHALGVGVLIVTNAAGGLNPDYRAGDLMLIRDHLNFPGMAGNNPLRGPNHPSLGPRFPDMSAPYDAALRALAHNVAAKAGFSLREGVYAYVAGPSFETPAELRFLRMAGGDAVGMSTASEVVTARHSGVRVLGISNISNVALVDPIPGVETSHEEVLEAGRLAVPRLISVIRGVVAGLEA